MSSSPSVLEDISQRWLGEFLAPLAVDRFMEEYWEQQLMCWAPVDSVAVRGWFTFDDARCRLQFSPATQRDLRLFYFGNQLNSENYTNASGVVDYDRVEELIDGGASLNVNQIQRFSRHFRSYTQQFCRALQTHDISVNLYYTPPNARGLPAHYDTHSIFAVQVEGSKRWSFYGRHANSPLKGLNSGVVSKVGVPEFERVLQAGEVLYLPRGLAHIAHCDEDQSVHLTVGLHCINWFDLLRRGLEEAARKEADIRRFVPMSWLASSDVEHIKEAISRLLDIVKEDFGKNDVIAKQLRVPAQPAPPLDRSLALDAESTLVRDHPLQWRPYENALWLKVPEVAGLPLRANCEPLLQFVNQRTEFRPVDLPGVAPEDARRFCSYLRLNGFVRLAEERAVEARSSAPENPEESQPAAAENRVTPQPLQSGSVGEE